MDIEKEEEGKGGRVGGNDVLMIMRMSVFCVCLYFFLFVFEVFFLWYDEESSLIRRDPDAVFPKDEREVLMKRII